MADSSRTVEPQLIGKCLGRLTVKYWGIHKTFVGDRQPELKRKLDVSLHPRHSPVTNATASLYRLPPEVLHNILLFMDIHSLATLKKVSLFARTLVTQMPQYSRIAINMPGVLRVLISTGLAPFLSLENLHQNLRQSSCTSCGDFAPFVYLPTCERVCVVCLNSRFKFQPVTTSEAKSIYKLGSRALSKLPTFWPLHGTYSHWHKEWRRRIRLYDRDVITAAARARAGPSFGYVRIPSTKTETDLYRHMTAMRVPWLNPEDHRLEWGLTCAACVRRNKRRHPTEKPYSDRQDDHWCYSIEKEELEDEKQDHIEQSKSADKRRRTSRMDYRTVYTKQGFIEHIKDCSGSRQLLNELLREELKAIPRDT